MHRLGVVLATAALCGCGGSTEVGGSISSNAESLSQQDHLVVPDSQCRTMLLRPMASGTVRSVPEQQMTAVAPGNDVQSTYFQTAVANTEVRRGIAEFELPKGRIVSAALTFVDLHGWAANPVPADWHRLSRYPADGVVDAADYQRESLTVGTFSTDLNDMNVVARRFELPQLTPGSRVGFRLELLRMGDALGSQGSGFGDVGLEVLTCGDAQLTDDPTLDPSGVR